MGSFSKKLSSGGHRNCSAEGRERLSSARTRGQVVPARHFSPEDWGRCGSRRKENSLGYWVATQGSPPMPTKEDMVMFQVRKPASGLAFIFLRKPSRHWPYHLPCTAPRPQPPHNTHPRPLLRSYSWNVGFTTVRQVPFGDSISHVERQTWL